MTVNNTPVRVAQLNSLLTGGGTDDQCVKLAAELHQLEQKVFLLGPGGSRLAPLIRERHVPFFNTGENAGKLGFILRAAAFIRRENIQIIHGHHGRDYWPTVLAARLSGVHPKVILTRHLAKSPGARASRRWLLNQCDAMIAVSRFVDTVLRQGVYEPDAIEAERRSRPPMRGNHARLRVIPGGIDLEKFQPAPAAEKRKELGLDQEDYAFAVIGGVDLPRGKGQREFLEAAARVIKEVPRARFLIVGQGSLMPILRTDISRLGLRGKARLTGQLSDIPAVINAIDCLVHPQVGTEALGLVVGEAHACGKPVIASALDGIPEAFSAGNYGRLVPPEDVSTLAAAMIVQASQPPLTAAQAQALHSQIKSNFSLKKMGARTLALYRELLSLPA